MLNMGTQPPKVGMMGAPTEGVAGAFSGKPETGRARLMAHIVAVNRVNG
jgi:hypothetical protein